MTATSADFPSRPPRPAAPASPGEEAPEAHWQSKILVLDDERLIRLTLSAKLRMVGYEAVAVASVHEAVALLQDGGCRKFRAIITDISMEGMDGFVFRDIVRGLDATMPMFFMTAFDPEEGGGFLKRILEDPNSYYLPKSVKAEVLLKRVQSIVATRRVEQFIEKQAEQSRHTLALAAQVQRSMLPPRAGMGPESFYTVWWRPKEEVSGDLYEMAPQADGSWLYVLGDVQGHGVSAALAMTAVQAYLRQLVTQSGRVQPHGIANQLQRFFRETLADVSYMTAFICVHRPAEEVIEWIGCGAPDPVVLDPLADGVADANPEKRGGLPIGLMPETVYRAEDEVRTPMPRSSVCVAHTDGVLEISRDPEGNEQMGEEERRELRDGIFLDARRRGSVAAGPYKFMAACRAMGYDHLGDDVTELMFGAKWAVPRMFHTVVAINAVAVDEATRAIEAWGAEHGWDVGLSTRVQLVFEEQMMNLYDHGFDYRQRLREAAWVRIRDRDESVELTLWDCGSPVPSMEVAAGSTDVAFDLANKRFSGGGRGRLMTRNLCRGIERNRYDILNETIYHIPKKLDDGKDG